MYIYIFIYLCTNCLTKLPNVWDQVAQDPKRKYATVTVDAVSVLTLYSYHAYLLSWYILLLMLDVSFCVDCLHLARFASTMQLLFVLKFHTLDVPQVRSLVVPSNRIPSGSFAMFGGTLWCIASSESSDTTG